MHGQRRTPLMGRAIRRLLVICFAWSLGAVLVYIFGALGFDIIVPGLFAVAAYALTRDEGYGSRGGGSGGGNVKYWRGRRVDDRPPRRWN